MRKSTALILSIPAILFMSANIAVADAPRDRAAEKAAKARLLSCSFTPLPEGTLVVGRNYQTARNRILASGYLPHPPKGDRKNYCAMEPVSIGYPSRCKALSELAQCSAEGYCNVYFSDPRGNRIRLVVQTWGGSLKRGKVDGWGSSCAGNGDKWFY